MCAAAVAAPPAFRERVIPVNQQNEKRSTPVIAIGSGKGGVGKSVVASNLALLLGREGGRVVLVDLDTGGANVHVLFGHFTPEVTLSDFLNRRVDSLAGTAITLESHYNLKIIAGAGESLRTANLPYATKTRLLRALRRVDSDLVLMDLGPGTGYNELDFFLLGDIQVAISTGDPTAIIDVYRFIKLAAIRQALSPFRQYEAVTQGVATRDFATIAQVLDAVESYDENRGRERSEKALEAFRPALILNRIDARGNSGVSMLRTLLKKYVGKDLRVLGNIPEDRNVEKSVRGFLPVSDAYPESPAAAAFARTVRTLQLMVQMLN